MTTPVVENEPSENTGASDTDNMRKEDASAGSVQHSWPFIKKSPFWERTETLPVFQTLSQNPHFHPLSECAESFREATAVGLMITFAAMVKEIGSLNLEDPRSTYDNLLEKLGVLEMNGFDIVSMKDRVNKFLSVKDMLNESVEAANNARKLNSVTGALVDHYEKKIMELQEEFAAAKSEVLSLVD